MTSISVSILSPKRASVPIKFISYNVLDPVVVFTLQLPLDYTKSSVEQQISLLLSRSVEVKFAVKEEDGTFSWCEDPPLLEWDKRVYAFETLKQGNNPTIVTLAAQISNSWAVVTKRRICHPFAVHMDEDPLSRKSQLREHFAPLFNESDGDYAIPYTFAHAGNFSGENMLVISDTEVLINPDFAGAFNWSAVKAQESVVEHHMKDAWTLNSCIESFCKPDFIPSEDGRICPTCGKFTDTVKKTHFWTLPKCLVIHLKRFTNKLEKINQKVAFPDELELNQVDGVRKRYSLYAVCDHIGSINGGHYTAHIVSDDNSQWVFCDDTSTTISSRERAHSEAAYILFYEQIE